MRALLFYLKGYKKESVLGPLFKLLEASFELLVPLVMAALIDTGIGGADRGFIMRMGLVLLGLGLVGLICSITAQFFAAKAAVGMATGVRRALFAHIQSLSYSELDELGASTMITRMTSDVNQVQSGVNLALRLFLRSPFIVFGAMIMAFTIDVRAALIFAVAIPALSVVVFGIMWITMPLYKRAQAGLDRVLGITRENLTGARVIRAFGREEEEVQSFDERNEALTGLQRLVGRISALMNPLTYVILNAALIFLVWTGAWRVEAGAISQGAVVALVSYMAQILVELIKLANLIITVTKSMACWARVRGVLEARGGQSAPGETRGAPDAEAPAVQFDHVSMAYAGASEESLTDIHFAAARGQTIGVIGGTGSGKSTLVNLIPRFYDATTGRVAVAGVDVQDYALEDLRARIGVVPQRAALFAGTIRENLRWGRADADDAQLRRALERAQAWDFVSEKPGALDFEIEQGGRNLSGGQRQRLTIARALVREPDILILDDSASALDFATDARLRKAIGEMRDATVFIVSQRASSIQYADQIIVLEDGRMAGLGTHEQLLRDSAVYREIYYSQFPKEDA